MLGEIPINNFNLQTFNDILDTSPANCVICDEWTNVRYTDTIITSVSPLKIRITIRLPGRRRRQEKHRYPVGIVHLFRVLQAETQRGEQHEPERSSEQ